MGLLIITADDWGHVRTTTDAIHECFEAGAVTSVSAMVHMSDSARAAELAATGGEPVGLHLNLTEPFTAPDCPRDVSARQRAIAAYLDAPKWRMWSLNARMFTYLDYAAIGVRA